MFFSCTYTAQLCGGGPHLNMVFEELEGPDHPALPVCQDLTALPRFLFVEPREVCSFVAEPVFDLDSCKHTKLC